MIWNLTTYLAIIFLAGLAGAVPPFLGRWSQKQLHLFVAFGSGVFLGTIFFHLLPETLALGDSRLTQFTILIGFLIVLAIDRLTSTNREPERDGTDENRHRAIGLTALSGLTLHSITAGFSLGLGQSRPQTGLVIFLAILSHKAVAAFSLATVFRLSGYPVRRCATMLILFAASTPLGAILALPLVPTLDRWHPVIPMALATGTFMYVSIMNLLPEAFHHEPRRGITFAALALGISAIWGITLIGP